MIPFAILSCQICRNGYENQEVRILDLSEEGFTFRLVRDFFEENAEKMNVTIPGEGERTVTTFVLHFFQFRESKYREVILSDYQLEVEEEQEFYVLYRLTTESERYRQYAKDLMTEYMRYISLKLNEDDARLSKSLVGYPAELEEKYASDFEEQKKTWFTAWNTEKDLCQCAENHQVECEETSDFTWMDEAEKPGELALSLDRPELWEQYLKLPLEQFVKEYWRRNHLSYHPLAQKQVTHLYVGNQFCHLLFPKQDVLFDMLEKAEREHVEVVLVFTYMQESMVESTEKLLDVLAKWCQGGPGQADLNNQKQLELVINDWGMLSLIRDKKYDCFKLTLGVLLQKQRKDVRMKYKQEFQQNPNQLGESAVQAEFYREHLQEYFGIQRISYEACGYPVKIAPGKASIHLPFYQMNTSQNCTLYARCHNGDRGRQTAVRTCPGYCRNQVFLYPEMLHMVGRYNSLFGYDETILMDGKILQSYMEQGVDRIVMELL